MKREFARIANMSTIHRYRGGETSGTVSARERYTHGSKLIRAGEIERTYESYRGTVRAQRMAARHIFTNIFTEGVEPAWEGRIPTLATGSWIPGTSPQASPPPGTLALNCLLFL